jgi:hypothetical protein
VTRYLLAGALILGVARLLLTIPVRSPSPMAAALAMRDDMVRKGMGSGVASWSRERRDFGGIRLLPRYHKDSLWPHVQNLYAAQHVEMTIFVKTACSLGPDSEILLRDLAQLPHLLQ